MKKVLLLIVDALSSRVVNPALERGELPNLRRLTERGHLAPESTTVFPSLTPAATASLVTGRYPAAHEIAGAFWFDDDNNEVAYYCDDFWLILRKGFSEFFEDFLVRLNGDRIRAPTAFEIVERAGRHAASLNYLWFRGLVEHDVQVPGLLNLLPGVSRHQQVMGPQTLYLGDFVRASDRGPSTSTESESAGVFRRYGFEDQTTATELIEMAHADKLPDFTLAYFPDNDFESHKVGPDGALPVVEKFDATLGDLLEACGGIDSALDQYVLVITGDHSQSLLVDDEPAVYLDQILKDSSVAKAGQPWTEGDEVMICPNMRAAQIYIRDENRSVRERVVDRLLSNERVDQVFSRRPPVGGRPEAFRIDTADRGSLTFWSGETDNSAATDHYGNAWHWEGDLRTIDASCGADDEKIIYGDYPNAMERIAMGFATVSGDLWLTARLGYEFAVRETSVNPRGSHGSLHKADSTSPLVVCGANNFCLPDQPRAIDVLPLCLRELNIDSEMTKSTKP